MTKLSVYTMGPNNAGGGVSIYGLSSSADAPRAVLNGALITNAGSYETESSAGISPSNLAVFVGVASLAGLSLSGFGTPNFALVDSEGYLWATQKSIGVPPGQTAPVKANFSGVRAPLWAGEVSFTGKDGATVTLAIILGVAGQAFAITGHDGATNVFSMSGLRLSPPPLPGQDRLMIAYGA